MTSLRQRVATGVVALAVAAGACAGPRTAGEPEFGLGDKADGLCDPRGELCWPTRDLAAMRRLQRLDRDVALGRLSPDSVLAESVELAEALSHKLEDGELAALAEIGDAAHASAGEDAAARRALDRLRDEVLDRLAGTYYTAYMVPAGRAASLALSGKSDDGAASGLLPASDPGYSEGMRASLDKLRDSGVSGIAYAAVIEMSGSLDDEYEVLDRDSFYPPSGMSRDERAAEIIDEYSLWAAGSGAVSGLISLIPIYGIPISIPVSAVGAMVIHSRMALEIAAVYGWDIQEGENLFIVSMFLLTDAEIDEESGELPPVGKELASLSSLPHVVQGVARNLGVPVSTTLAVKLTANGMLVLFKYLVKKAEKLIANTAIKSAERAIAGQVLGWATLGLAVAASAAADYYVTQNIGRHVAVMARPWLVDLPMESTPYLRTESARDCFFSALSSTLWADGALTGDEKAYYRAFLGKRYYEGDGRWFVLESAERRRRAGELALAAVHEVECFGDTFEDEPISDKLTILSHLYAAVLLNRAIDGAEDLAYQSFRSALDGSGFFDGDEIDPYELLFVESAVRSALVPSSSNVSESYADAIEALEPSDILSYLDDVDPAVAADFECGFAGSCGD